MTRRLHMATPWRDGQVAGHCESCGSVWLVPPEALGLPCLACGRAGLLPSSATLPDGEPELVAPLTVTREAAAAKVAEWLAETPMPEAGMQAAALPSRLRLVWWPRWLIDTTVVGTWSAEVGFDYETKSSRETFRDGQGWVSEDVTDVRIRWEERAGEITRHYPNAEVAALHDDGRRARRLGQVNFTGSAPHIEGAILLPDVGTDAAWPSAEADFRHRAGMEVAQAVSAQHVRNVTLRAEHTERNYTWSLRPAWTTTYEVGGEAHLVVVDASNGTIVGPRFASWSAAATRAGLWLTAAAVVFAIIAALSLLAFLFPPLLAIGPLAMVVPLVVALGAIAPPARVWAWNSRHGSDTLARPES